MLCYAIAPAPKITLLAYIIIKDLMVLLKKDCFLSSKKIGKD